jgi:hypothetical protein
MRRHRRPLGILLVVVLLVAGTVGYLWLTDELDPMPEARAALESDAQVTVSSDSWLTFAPTVPSNTGFIFYPGARVPVEAYAPSLRSIAEAGYLVVAVPMPFGLAVLSPDAADGVIDSHPDVESWVIGGHSLGGAMAAGYAHGHDDIDGLALWAAYPAGDSDLSTTEIDATSVYASEDGLATLDELEASASRLPADTAFVEIEGGNHAQFGWYGAQDGDGQATITRQVQQEQVVDATVELIETVEGPSLDG